MKLDMLKKMAVKLEIKKNAIFSYPVKKQKRIVSGMNEPHDDVERSYRQYQCQMRLNGTLTSLVLNFISFPVIIYFYFKKCRADDEGSDTREAVFISGGISDNVIPESLKNEFKTWNILSNYPGESFTSQDKEYFRKIILKYPVSWHFLLKCIIKLRLYSYIIDKYQPKAIIACEEYSFTSSLLTDYCNHRDVHHINVMHGEKLYYMRDSFFRFHRCYIWDNHYKDLFIQLRAEPNQFRIAIPPSLKFSGTNHSNKTIDYTYYLGAEKDAVLTAIIEALIKLKNKGFRVALRPHPRYSDMDEINKFRSEFDIEDIKKIGIEASLFRTKKAISVYSTVLNQAFYNGVGVVIDDVSNPAKYERLKEVQYIMLSKEHEVLSHLLASG